MPITTGSTVEYPNVRVLHMTKNNTPQDSVSIAFSVIDDTGTEQIVQAQCPTAAPRFKPPHPLSGPWREESAFWWSC
jgi:hypothetical protein